MRTHRLPCARCAHSSSTAHAHPPAIHTEVVSPSGHIDRPVRRTAPAFTRATHRTHTHTHTHTYTPDIICFYLIFLLIHFTHATVNREPNRATTVNATHSIRVNVSPRSACSLSSHTQDIKPIRRACKLLQRKAIKTTFKPNKTTALFRQCSQTESFLNCSCHINVAPILNLAFRRISVAFDSLLRLRTSFLSCTNHSLNSNYCGQSLCE